jgi:hypothetical protein
MLTFIMYSQYSTGILAILNRQEKEIRSSLNGKEKSKITSVCRCRKL